MKKQVLDAFNFRHACKVFDENKKITDSDMEYILETGRLSPSSFGFEPWQFVVVQDTDVREKIKAVSWGVQRSMMTCSHAVLIFARKGSEVKYDSEYIDYMMRSVQGLPQEVIDKKGGFFKQFQQEDFKLNTEEKLLDWSKRQCYIALGNMMTSAAMIGIDSCPIEGFNIEAITKVFKEENIIDTSKFELASMALFGYRIEAQGKKTRRSSSEVIKWIK